MKSVQIVLVLLAVWTAPVTGKKPRYQQPRHGTNGTPLSNEDLNYLLQSSLADYSNFANNFQLYTSSLFPEHVAVPSVDTTNTIRTRRAAPNLIQRLAEELARILQRNRQKQQMPGPMMKEGFMKYLGSQAGDGKQGV